jgi:competence protein ComEA
VEKIIQFLKQYGVLVGIGLVGVGVLIYGVYLEVSAEKPVVEIVKGDGKSEKGESAEIMVDVAGAVEKPGLYKLTSGSRIGDALVMAGGLSATADREWVAKSINLAEVLKDGGKVYVPVLYKDDPSQTQSKGSSLGTANNKININTASMSELDGLMGIGEVRARLIMDNRPYSNIDELVSKAKIPQSVYEEIKDSVSIY